MRPYYFPAFFLISALWFTACKQPGRSSAASRYFQPDSIPSFFVEVDITRDTILHAPGGSLLHITAHALDAGGATHVKLAIKEALRISDIIRASLLTLSDGQMLSSGGMIDIEPIPGQTVKILKPISVSIPTSYLEKNMQLYKGVVGESGKINWTDPSPLPVNPQMVAIDTGEQIFVRNCAPCHATGKSVTGPDLAYIGRLRDKKWMYDFIRNNQNVLRSGDRYANCLYEHYNKTAMPLFPLTDVTIDGIIRYIDNESIRRGQPIPDDHLKKCVDSCKFYDQQKADLLSRRQKLIVGNDPQLSVSMRHPAGYISPDTGKSIPKVSPRVFQSVYYQFNISSFGWYNVDRILQNMEGVKESELSVTIKGEYRDEISAFLVIPSVKVFEAGGPLDRDQYEYGFYTGDGKVFLPQGVPALVIAMGEQNGKLIFSLSSFRITEKQTLELTPELVSKDEMNRELQALDLQDISLKIQDSKNADSIRETDRQLKDIERLKPRTCDCNCGIISDTPEAAVNK
jgi:mono/diheme cytochrome c family protein